MFSKLAARTEGLPVRRPLLWPFLGNAFCLGAGGAKGEAAEAARVINLFDRYQPEKAVVIPPAFLDHAH